MLLNLGELEGGASHLERFGCAAAFCKWWTWGPVIYESCRETCLGLV